MRTWVKATLAVIAVIVLCFVALAGTGAYYVFRGLDRRAGPEGEAVKAIAAVKGTFPPRPPLIEIVDPKRADIRINRSDTPAAAVKTLHVINWNGESGELVRMEVPLWLMRFSSLNILSQLGIAPEKFRLTVSDIERYGPGIIVDYASPGVRMLVWVD